MVEVDLGEGKSGSAQITAFMKLDGGIDRQSEGVIIRWMDKSSLSTHTDHRDRPICDHPLSFNHCSIIVCGNGRKQLSTDSVFEHVGSGTELQETICGVMLKINIVRTLSVLRLELVMT